MKPKKLWPPTTSTSGTNSTISLLTRKSPTGCSPDAVRNWIVDGPTLAGSIGRLKRSTICSFCAMSEIAHVLPWQPRLHASRQTALTAPPVQAVGIRAAPAWPPEQPAMPARKTTRATRPGERNRIDASGPGSTGQDGTAQGLGEGALGC